jgi:hypothetical protein
MLLKYKRFSRVKGKGKGEKRMVNVNKLKALYEERDYALEEAAKGRSVWSCQ